MREMRELNTESYHELSLMLVSSHNLFFEGWFRVASQVKNILWMVRQIPLSDDTASGERASVG